MSELQPREFTGSSNECNTPDAKSPPKSRAPQAVGKFIERTSLAGVPYLKSISSRSHMAFWIFVLVVAVGATVYQIVMVCVDYMGNPYVTTLSVDHKKLNFPTITICNANVVRSNQVYKLPASVQDFLEDFAPATSFAFNLAESENSTAHSVVKRQTMAEADVLSALGNFGSGQQSLDDILRAEFMELMGNLSRELRQDVGHQLESMLISCSFNGLVCDASDFFHFLSDTYGNCYMFNSADIWEKSLQSLNSGSRLGFTFEVMLEKFYYMAGFTENTGAQLAVHPFGTFPAVSDDSISVAPGTQTSISLKLEETQRLGVPFPPCGDGGEYSSYYNLTYNQHGCTLTCTERKIAENCSCVRPAYTEYYPVHIQLALPKCTDLDQTCVDTWVGLVHTDGASTVCGCNQGCNETDFKVTVSSMAWPDEAIYYSLVDTACANIDIHQCLHLRSANSSLEKRMLLSDNMATIQVYYETLNFLKITEQPTYTVGSFLSNIGGTLGLYTGATVINFVELFDFMAVLCFVICKPKRGGPENDANENQMNITEMNINNLENNTDGRKERNGFGS